MIKLSDVNKEILNEGKEKHSFGCVMIDVPLSKEQFNLIQNDIPDEDLYNGTKEDPGYGREDEPHITLLYGIHSDVPDDDVEKIIKEFKSCEIEAYTIGLFENDNKPYDVVKFDVNNNKLTEMNSKLKKLPFTSDFPDYHAHITIAYVKKGLGEKYVKKYEEKLTFTPTKIIYSKANGSKKNYPFKNK